MTTSSKISVLLAEDHAVVREGLCGLLNADDHFVVVGQARNGREAVQMAASLQPDVILMDMAMPILNGLEATRQIIAANPDAKVIILSAHSEDEYIESTRAAGVVGFLEKQTSSECLTKAVREVAAGNAYFSPSITRRLLLDVGKARDRNGMVKVKRTRLTSRETEVLQMVAEGSANKQVAALLCISIKTVEKHRQSLMDKLNIHEIAGLTRYAIATGVIEGGVRVTIV